MNTVLLILKRVLSLAELREKQDEDILCAWAEELNGDWNVKSTNTWLSGKIEACFFGAWHESYDCSQQAVQAIPLWTNQNQRGEEAHIQRLGNSVKKSKKLPSVRIDRVEPV